MARYTGPSWKISRRLKYSVTETGKELGKRPYPPGQHGQRRSKISEYGMQLQEKQKVRFTYGLNEKQFRKTFNEAKKMQGKQGENFLFLLESRIDNLVYRSGLARTRRQSRQLVNHGHVYVDGGFTIQSFIRAELLDELILTQIPILLGKGRPLFAEVNKDVKLKLMKSQSYSSGFVQSRYKVDRYSARYFD